MNLRRFFMPMRIFAVCVSCPISLIAADKNKGVNTSNDTRRPSYELPQPQKESLDYLMYQSIRKEAIVHSHVMEYATALMDGIGARLTGSPNLKRANDWTREQFVAMGCANAHLEDWGEFGMGWEQVNTWVRMTVPDMAVFIAQAAPWSPATKGVVNAAAVWVDIEEEKDFETYRGRVAGKVVFLGAMREVKPVDRPLSIRFDDSELKNIQNYPLKNEDYEQWFKAIRNRSEFLERIGQFLAAERAVAVILPSRDGNNSGGSGGTIFDDRRAGLGGMMPYQREHINPLPIAVTTIENFGRVYRLLKAGVAVAIEMSIETRFTGDHEHGFNTIAEIPGVDPTVRDEVVMVGAHLDSWASATGATDNGAGTIVAMEVMRILNSLRVNPRRTIRVALWTGEEQHGLGSYGYVKQHFGSAPHSTEAEERNLTEDERKVTGPLELKSAQRKVAAYFNLDNGGGAIRGVYLQQNAMVAPIFTQWIEPLKDLGVTTLTLRDTLETDHVSFDTVGIPAFQFIQDPLEYNSRSHHSNMDTYERLLSEDLIQAAVVETIFVYNTAMRDEMLPRKSLPSPDIDVQSALPKMRILSAQPNRPISTR